MAFHNPYTFIPVEKRTDDDRARDLALNNGQPTDWRHHGHDRYHATTPVGNGTSNVYSGRIQCTLKTVTPTLVGAKQTSHEEDIPSDVEGYMRDGAPAIPASSLKGLFSSLAEAATASSLRVLEKDRTFSRRVLPDGTESLSAIGELVDAGNGVWKLKPRCLPTLSGFDPASGTYEVPQKWKRCFPKPVFKVLCGMYKAKDPNAVKKEYIFTSPISDTLRLSQPSYYQGNQIQHSTQTRRPSKDSPESPRPFMLGIEKDPAGTPTHGLPRVLGKYDMPTKLHELFIPTLPPSHSWPELDVPDDVIQRFKRIFRDRYRDSDGKLPHIPALGATPLVQHPPARSKDLELDDIVIHAGDLVYFDVEDLPAGSGSGTLPKVCEIAYSAIWRKAIPGTNSAKDASVGDFFKKIDREYLPFHAERKRITPAELMFGFTRDEQPGSGTNGNNHVADHMAFRGKIVFEDALPNQPEPAGGWTLDELTLPILASPKPPCPPMYFRIRTDAAGRGRPTYEDRHIAKSALTLPDCIPKGRKVYLHHKIGLFRATHQSAQDYLRTQRQNPPPDKQQMNVRPIKAGVGFEFSIRFDNLDEWELGCLLYVLKPTATYNHKVGLGKPVGMGSVDIAIAKVETINRGKKYSWQGWSAAAHYTTSLDAQSQRTMRASFRTTINLRTRTMLEAVGEPDRVTCRVMYPRAQNQLNNQGMPNTEDELFGWFVNNDDLFMRQRQALGTDLLYNNMPSFVPNQKPERPQHH